MLALGVIACGGAPVEQHPPAGVSTELATPQPAPHVASLKVLYSEPANVFEIMDNVSNWLPDKCDQEYLEDWNKRFSPAPGEKEAFTAYAALRKKHYHPASPPEKGADGKPRELFGPLKPSDEVAEAFYSSATLDEALTKVLAVTSPEEAAQLRGFYALFKPKYDELLKESEAFPALRDALQRHLDQAGAAEACDRIARFYGVGDLPDFTLLLVWWPPVDNTTANNRGRFLLMKYNPEKHRKSAEGAVEIPIHEFAHFVSTHQPKAQKERLTSAFLAGCDPGEVPINKVLEEPLAVVQQKRFLSRADPTRFDRTRPWYGGDRWIGPFAKLIFDSVVRAEDAGGKLDDALMTDIAGQCSSMPQPKHP